MRSRRICFGILFLTVASSAAQYRDALPGYRYEFPRDHFNHTDFQTEWWYYTGNVRSADGHRFGFELTFFRQSVDRDATKSAAWDLRDLYIAHLALSDLDGGKFFHAERANRAGPGIAGASETESRIWNGNWRTTWRGNEQTVEAIEARFQLHFTLRATKPPVIHGENGVSQKANGEGRASYYISLTRLTTDGEVELGGRKFQVAGSSWMDHEFFTHQLEADQAGWDWMSVQLDDNTELMLFNIRRKGGSMDAFSSGTFVDARGNTLHLRKNDFTLEPAGENWTSPETGTIYPTRWRISIPKLGVQLESSTLLASQELDGSAKLVPAYWEGAIFLNGQKGAAPIHGAGYLEMTGYDHPVDALR